MREVREEICIKLFIYYFVCLDFSIQRNPTIKHLKGPVDFMLYCKRKKHVGAKSLGC